MRIVRQNLAWAFGYNVLIIPLAAFGYVSPAVAAAGMAASSLLVVGNALRAKRLPRA
jgi:cation transport ATPase